MSHQLFFIRISLNFLRSLTLVKPGTNLYRTKKLVLITRVFAEQAFSHVSEQSLGSTEGIIRNHSWRQLWNRRGGLLEWETQTPSVDRAESAWVCVVWDIITVEMLGSSLEPVIPHKDKPSRQSDSNIRSWICIMFGLLTWIQLFGHLSRQLSAHRMHSVAIISSGVVQDDQIRSIAELGVSVPCRRDQLESRRSTAICGRCCHFRLQQNQSRAHCAVRRANLNLDPSYRSANCRLEGESN